MPVIDASVYVSLTNESDRHHGRCVSWLGETLETDESLVAPSLLLVEVTASIRRLTGDGKLAARVGDELQALELVELVPLTLERSKSAAMIAAKTAVRGADAVYLALAKERRETLVTLDRQQLERGGEVATVQRP